MAAEAGSEMRYFALFVTLKTNVWYSHHSSLTEFLTLPTYPD